MNAFIETVGTEELAIGRSGCRETTRHAYAEIREIADHFTERCVFSADVFNVVHAKLRELDYIWLQVRLPCVPWQELDNPTNGLARGIFCLGSNRRYG